MIPPRIGMSGNKARAASLIGLASKQLDILKHQMSFQNLLSGRRHISSVYGDTIEVIQHGTLSTINIFSPFNAEAQAPVEPESVFMMVVMLALQDYSWDVSETRQNVVFDSKHICVAVRFDPKVLPEDPPVVQMKLYPLYYKDASDNDIVKEVSQPFSCIDSWIVIHDEQQVAPFAFWQANGILESNRLRDECPRETFQDKPLPSIGTKLGVRYSGSTEPTEDEASLLTMEVYGRLRDFTQDPPELETPERVGDTQYFTGGLPLGIPTSISYTVNNTGYTSDPPYTGWSVAQIFEQMGYIPSEYYLQPEYLFEEGEDGFTLPWAFAYSNVLVNITGFGYVDVPDADSFSVCGFSGVFNWGVQYPYFGNPMPEPDSMSGHAEISSYKLKYKNPGDDTTYTESITCSIVPSVTMTSPRAGGSSVDLWDDNIQTALAEGRYYDGPGEIYPRYLNYSKKALGWLGAFMLDNRAMAPVRSYSPSFANPNEGGGTINVNCAMGAYYYPHLRLQKESILFMDFNSGEVPDGWVDASLTNIVNYDLSNLTEIDSDLIYEFFGVTRNAHRSTLTRGKADVLQRNAVIRALYSSPLPPEMVEYYTENWRSIWMYKAYDFYPGLHFSAEFMTFVYPAHRVTMEKQDYDAFWSSEEI